MGKPGKQRLPKYIPKKWCFGFVEGKGCVVLRDTYCLYSTSCAFYKLKREIADGCNRDE